MKNNYIIDGDTVRIQIVNRKGDRFESLIDLEDLERVKELNLSWHVKWENHVKSYYCKATRQLGYLKGKSRCESVHLHRVIMDANGRTQIPDHISHNTLDNRKRNLVLKHTGENSKNRKGKNSNNKSGYRNVCWINNKWTVQIQINGKNTKLGAFDDIHEAGKYAEKMREKYYGKNKGKG